MWIKKKEWTRIFSLLDEMTETLQETSEALEKSLWHVKLKEKIDGLLDKAERGGD